MGARISGVRPGSSEKYEAVILAKQEWNMTGFERL